MISSLDTGRVHYSFASEYQTVLDDSSVLLVSRFSPPTGQILDRQQFSQVSSLSDTSLACKSQLLVENAEQSTKGLQEKLFCVSDSDQGSTPT